MKLGMHDFVTWLEVEMQLEKEWENVQESAFAELMRREQRMGTGEKQSDVITVQPYDENRVVLRDLGIDEEEDPTFINASYVDQKHYIAAAMPHNVTSERDFWRMLFEANAKTVVMLNKPTERKKSAYWPTMKEKIRSYNNAVKVVLLEESYDDQIYCWIRKLRVIVNPVFYEEGTKGWSHNDDVLRSHDYTFEGDISEDDQLLQRWSSTVTHLQYDDWDDMRVPDDKAVFFQFMSMTLKQHEDAKIISPMVVHCFGGVGRTGAFLVIHSTIRKLTRVGGKVINVRDILGMLRNERSSLVQTPEQYKFCYRIIWQFNEERRSFRNALLDLKQVKQMVQGDTEETIVQNAD